MAAAMNRSQLSRPLLSIVVSWDQAGSEISVLGNSISSHTSLTRLEFDNDECGNALKGSQLLSILQNLPNSLRQLSLHRNDFEAPTLEAFGHALWQLCLQLSV